MGKTNVKKFNKIRLRGYKDTDFEFLHGLLNDETTRKFFPLMYVMEKEETFQKLKQRLVDQRKGVDTRYVIEDMRKRKPVGEISGRPAKDDASCMELAILIHPDFRGQDFAKDGIFEFIKMMREKKPDIMKFRMEIAENNKASQAVAKKLEFKLKGEREYGPQKAKVQCWEDR